MIRFITSILIVFIHCPFPGTFGQYCINLGRFGVPFFLIVSGWFSYHPNKDTLLSRLRKKFFDTLKLLGTVTIAYCIMNSIKSVVSGYPPYEWIGTYFNIRHARHQKSLNH